jgi:hypothetical protein
MLLIAAVVQVLWVLTNAMRNNEEKRRQSTSGSEGRSSTPVRSRPPTDVDLFLEKINQRRREAAARQGAQPRPEPVATRPRPSAPRTEPTRRPGTPVAVAIPTRPSPGSLRVPVAEPARPERAAPVAVLAEEVAVVPLAQGAPGSVAANAAPAEAPTVVMRKRPSPAATHLATLMRTRQGLRAAFLLQEVLGKPVSMRRPRLLSGGGDAAPPEASPSA